MFYNVPIETSLSGYSTSPKALTTKRGIDLALLFLLPILLAAAPSLAVSLTSTSSSPVPLLQQHQICTTIECIGNIVIVRMCNGGSNGKCCGLTHLDIIVLCKGRLTAAIMMFFAVCSPLTNSNTFFFGVVWWCIASSWG